MAKASRRKSGKIRLTLTPKEANAVHAVLAARTSSPECYTYDVYDVLDDALGNPDSWSQCGEDEA